jgi:hypothetical protein
MNCFISLWNKFAFEKVCVGFVIIRKYQYTMGGNHLWTFCETIGLSTLYNNIIFMWINVTLCERYQYVRIGLSIASTSTQDFMQLYNAFHLRFWPLVNVDLSRGHLKFFWWHSYTYSLSLTRKHKMAYNFLWKLVCHGYLKMTEIRLLVCLEPTCL